MSKSMNLDPKSSPKLHNGKEILNPFVTLSHPTIPDVVVEFDPLDRKHTWMEHAVLVPWAAPHRLFGWIHPMAEPDKEPFVLHAAFIYMGSVGMQPVGENKLRAVEGPKILLPYDMISFVDLDIYRCPSLLFFRKQDKAMNDLFVELVKQHVFPPSNVKIVTPGEIPVDLRNGAPRQKR